MRPNCSWIGPEIPLSKEVFSAIKDELWLFLIPAGLALITVGLFLEEVGFFLRHVPSPTRRQLSLWILGMYPVFALSSLVALYVPRSSSLCNFLASLYHSFTLLKFMGLITDLFGGEQKMMEALSAQTVAPDPFPCCCCCCLPLVAVNRSSRVWMMAAVLQLSVVRSILFFVTLVLWTDEQYDYGDVDSVNPNLYVNAIIGVSTLVSFYGHLLFYQATRRALPGYALRAKFVCVVLVLVLCGLQSGILETMGALRVFPCTQTFSVLARSQLIYHYCVIVEMCCISLYARCTFRKVEPSLDEREEEAPSAHEHEEQAQSRGEREEKAVQTHSDGADTAGRAHYRRDSGDSLCRIEHAPLEDFTFTKLMVKPTDDCRTEADSTSVTVV